MAYDPICYDICVAGCFAVCIAIPPPLGEVLIAGCGLGCLATCQTENVVLNDGMGGPTFPTELPPDIQEG